ncbi:hydroxymethylglutaryl-CoA synthase [Arthroderma uncinatum]|uniref:hydroxymethylglutaryl-CoA synthase n=1 Tax=Arthroderma uncinatum TaxID=74035 RepID=UPI00144AD93E|nr:hydroxymethylglutaryl-CoA synthase [Arthroderma uncinatum]KAF3480655.1 hydroxymethylglutaryl-CoA synthase [Arthroderma uncinatum]
MDSYLWALKIYRVLTKNLQCVDQAELEKADGVSSGKYTAGLGQTRMSFCNDREDFSSEYPIVHGHYSLECYTKALDKCYDAYKRQEERFTPSSTPAAQKVITDRFDYMCFHSPNTKLVSKAYARLSYNDFKDQPDHPSFSTINPSFRTVGYEESLKDRKLEATFRAHSTESFLQRVSPSITAPTMCGNMYTASLYSSLVSLLSNVEPEQLLGKKVGMFSYGSGLASTLFSLEIVGDTGNLRKALDLTKRLEARSVVDPVGYSKAIWLREKAHLQKDFVPHGEITSLAPGTYYLTKVDDQFRRSYSIAYDPPSAARSVDLILQSVTPPCRSSIQKLFKFKGSPRAIGILAIAKASGLELEEVEIQPANGVPDEYLKLNKLGKTPTFVGADGLVLTECIAIALYITSQDPTSTLLGASEMDFIHILRWLSLTNTDVVTRMADWVRPLIGYTPYSKEAVEKAQRETDQAIQIFEEHLQDRRFLVADRLTLADIFCAGLLTFGFAKVFDEKWRKRFPYFTGWFVSITNLPMFRAVAPVVHMVSVGMPNERPTEPFKAP